jgi:putative zinc finger protein
VDCATAKSRLGGLVSGTLTPEEKAETTAHLATCEGCRLEHHLLQAIEGTGTVPSTQPASPSASAATPELAPPPSAFTPPSFAVPAPLQPSFAAPAPPEPPPPPELVFPVSEAVPPLTLEPITPVLSTSDPEVSFADLTMESPVLSAAPGEAADSMKAKAGAGAPPAAGMPPKKTWNFEPVDPPRSSSPPEDSLNFAEEALNRSSRRAESRALFRIVLWGGGALAGVALLAVSVWMAMAHREPVDEPQALAPPTRSAVADSGADATPRVAAPDSTPATAAPSQIGAAPQGQTPPSMKPPAPLGVPLAGKPPVGSPPAKTLAPPTGSAAKSPTQPVPKTTSSAAAKTGTSATATKAPPTAGTKPSASASPSPAPAPASQPPAPETASSPAPPRRGPPTREEGFEPVVDTPPDKAVWSQSDFATPPTQRRPAGSATRPPVLVAPTPESAPSTPAPDSDVSGPIGRLHLATVQAQEARDLAALRKIKASWKAYLRTALGSERERSKRELADCLYAIQEITGRDADRREALTAYREYVLHAPAGGADPRTVSRMRHLEDVLSDSQ